MYEPALYVNHYEHCGQDWQDEWSCMCNDECPVCGKEIEPYQSDETKLLEQVEVLIGVMTDSQTKMWDAAYEIEELLDIEIDTTDDLAGVEVQSLLRLREY